MSFISVCFLLFFPNNQDIFDFAYKGDTDSLIRELKRGKDPDVINQIGWTPLMVAAKDGKIDIADILLRFGANLNTQNVGGRTPLMQAIKAGQTEMANWLVSKGANIHILNNQKRSVLHFAAIADNLEIAKVLVFQGAQIDSKDDRKKTPLMLCMSTKMASFLTEKGANLNAVDNNKTTVLMHACLRQQHLLIKFFLAKGVAIDCQNGKGRTALMLASGMCDNTAVLILLEHNANSAIIDHEGNDAYAWVTKYCKKADLIPQIIITLRREKDE